MPSHWPFLNLLIDAVPLARHSTRSHIRMNDHSRVSFAAANFPTRINDVFRRSINLAWP